MPSESFIIEVNRNEVRVTAETSVAAAMMMAGEACRISVHGEPRGPLCGMGICMECRATVNGIRHQRTCQMLCVPGMEVVTE
jgi:D-hydroxyproline dehydrogenase subunit gamma